MDLLSVIETRIDLIIAMVGIVEAVKTSVERKQFSIYKILTFGLGLFFAWLSFDGWKSIVLNGVIYFGLATFFYSAVLRYMNKLNDRVEKATAQ